MILPTIKHETPILDIRNAAARSVERQYLAPYCRHARILIDEQARRIECKDCKAVLDPIDVIMMFALEQTRMEQLHESNAAEKRVLEEKRRFKCANCGRFTNVSESGSRRRVEADDPTRKPE